MAESRVEKYRKYRQSIAQRSDNIPVLKSPSECESFASEAGFFKNLILKRRIVDASILLLIVAIITLLVIFGIIVF